MFLTTINPLDVFLWTVRRNEKDVINLYSTLSPVMQLATGGTMLNFGLWSKQNNKPLLAQNNLCTYFGNISELDSAKNVVDVGSGLSAPAILWSNQYPDLDLYCVNINYKQLACSEVTRNIELLNSSSIKLPFVNESVDRVVALESAQHFKPLSDFIFESKRILKKHGLFVLAMPVTLDASSLTRLGILKFTWSSEHYILEDVKNLICSEGFKISQEILIGGDVYDPLADYYIQNRSSLQKSILRKYPQFVESILFKSILKMKDASQKKVIDYVILKCSL